MPGVASESRETLPEFENIVHWMESEGYQVQAEKVRQLFVDSTQGPHVTIAFCGLFSAGKSSLLNALIDHGALATGAIPTTAKVDEVFLRDANHRVRLLDTPGVDSTDEAHRQATMDALHLADVVCLVADYQHVEAEENLDLLRMFTDEGKRLILIVNQVDKHLDFELSMESFRNHVEETLDDYGIVVEHVFYTSTKSSVYSQLPEFETWLHRLQDIDESERGSLLQSRLRDLVEKTASSVYRERIDSAEAKITELFGYAPLDIEEIKGWLEQTEHHLEERKRDIEHACQEREQVHRRKREEWVRAIELAQIAPYETTEKGRHYIESMRSDFKVGVIRSATKTEQERQRRAQVFVDDLADHVQHYLITPLRNQLYQDVQGMDWSQPSWLSDIERISIVVDVPYVQHLVKSGALVSHQYPYQYVKDVVGRVKRDVIAVLEPMVDGWFDDAMRRFETEHSDWYEEARADDEKMTSLTTYLELESEKVAFVESMLTGGEA